MNHFSINIYNLIMNLVNQGYTDEDIFQLENKFREHKWLIHIKDNNFKDKEIKFSKKTITDSLDLTFSNKKIHIFFYHKNTSTDKYYPTNAYIFGETLTNDSGDTLKECLRLVQ